MKKNLDNNSNLKKGRKWASIIAGFLGVTIAVTLGLTLTYPWAINSKNNSSKGKDSLGFIAEPGSNSQGWNSPGSSPVYYPLILTNETAMWLSSTTKPVYQSLGFTYTFYLSNTTGVALTSTNFQIVYEGINPSWDNGENSNAPQNMVQPTTNQQSEMLSWLTKNMIIDVSKLSSNNIQTITLYLPSTAKDLPSIGFTGLSDNNNMYMFYNYFFNSGFALTLLNSNLPTTNIFQNTSSLFSFSYYIPSSVVYFGNSNPSNISSSSSSSSSSNQNIYFYTNYNSIDTNSYYVYNGFFFNTQNVIFASSSATSNVTLIPSMAPSSYYQSGSYYTNPFSLDGAYTLKSVSYVTKDNLTSSTLSGNNITFNATDVNWNNNTNFNGVEGAQSSPYISANITILNTSSNDTITFSEIIGIINSAD